LSLGILSLSMSEYRAVVVSPRGERETRAAVFVWQELASCLHRRGTVEGNLQSECFIRAGFKIESKAGIMKQTLELAT
jgi:hypothetical protein